MKKMLIRIISVALAAVMLVACLASCGNSTDAKDEIVLPAFEGIEKQTVSGEIPETFKIGLICLHDKNSTYDKNFITAMEEVQAELGLKDSQVLISTGIPEGAECKDKAIEMAEAGCQVIIADSFGHESYMMEAAAQYPNVLFAHCTGTKAHTATDLNNYVNAFASIYEGRYLAGVVAGLKLKEMIDAGKITADKAKVGYVGAFTYAEVISGYTSWFLGVRSIVPEATMEVTFTGSWYDETAENNAAKKLISNGCVLISQHADSMGAPNACEEAGVPNVSYNGSTFSACPNTFLISSRINWAPYYKYLINCKVNGQTAVKDYIGTLKTGSVELTNLGAAVAEGTKDRIIETRNKLANGTLKVFDTSKFTVNGETLTKHLADVDDFGDYVGETNVIEGGAFVESKYRSAPYFDLKIDGITLLDEKYG
ncbi:MAG: BMP family ABC transporter substrate-binding protein [Clostridia bacterium]|nr:BMP family ABC transporter substrate-binding protein [Clostridia bacterium]